MRMNEMTRRYAVLTLVAVFALTGEVMAQGRPRQQVQPQTPAPAPTALLVYGGEGNRTFLGCLNCGEYDANSVRNQYGPHGSPYAAESITNKYGEFGSPYSPTSACNPYGSDPPIVVDAQGGFYGRLSANRYAPNRLSNTSMNGWLEAMCAR